MAADSPPDCTALFEAVRKAAHDAPQHVPALLATVLSAEAFRPIVENDRELNIIIKQIQESRALPEES